jgi:hypothetical protein
MDEKEIAQTLREKASKLNQAADVLDGSSATYAPHAPFPRASEKRRTGSRTMTKAAREAISRAQKARWAKQKKGTRKNNATEQK